MKNTDMKNADEKISLLPFIESDKDGFFLDIPVLNHDGTAFQGYSYPFQVVEQGHNFSIIVKGGLKVNRSDPFKELFLLIQRDHYPLSHDEWTSLTNTGIDRIWSETIQSQFSDKKNFIIPEQLTNDGKAIPFSPLFFCKNQQKFFHPPCPECGTELDLCMDDEILIKAALPPYSTSLKRYLFCPDCYASKGSYDFYQFSRSAEDPFFIKDRFDLVKDFNKLKTSYVSNRFPCLDCPGYAKCYVTGEKAMSYISFFSFYPFHMLFFNAEPIKAIDFIPLLSGASFNEVNAELHAGFRGNSREHYLTSSESPRFFFREEKKFYLEVLFLKLSFFEELIRSFCYRIGKGLYPISDISIQSIWIRPNTSGNILPFFWNFTLSIIDLISNVKKNYIESALTKNSSLYFMASLWFYVFTVNKNQGQDKVYNEIGRLAGKSINDAVFEDYNELTEIFPSLAMENIFWDPEMMEVPGEWYTFWKKILLTGLYLFDTGNEKSLQEDLNQLRIEIETLKQEIKQELFSKDVYAEPSVQTCFQTSEEKEPESDGSQMQPEADDNMAIALILKKLKVNWAAENEKAVVLDDDVLETVVLSSGSMVSTVPDEVDTDDEIEKTMIIPGPEQTPVVETGFDDMEKTVIISPAGGAAPRNYTPFNGQDSRDVDDDFEKTVIITPKK